MLNRLEDMAEPESSSSPPQSPPRISIKAEPASMSPQQQIYIIQTTDALPIDGEVVVAEDVAVYETVSALEQLSRGQVISSEDGELLQVYEEVVLPDGGSAEFVDVAEVEVGSNERSTTPLKIGALIGSVKGRRGTKKERQSSTNHIFVNALSTSPGSVNNGEFHICRICNQFVPVGDLAQHHAEHNLDNVSDQNLTCIDCNKQFKSKRSLFGHRKEKHSGIQEVHSCPECGKTFGRKSNLKAHRESLHYGKKFPCVFCERIFTNRSSMNQHIKKIHPENKVVI